MLLFYVLIVLQFCSCWAFLPNRKGKCGQHRPYDERDGYVIVGSDNPKGLEDIYRPCCLEDFDCMRNYLSENSNCIPAYGLTPDPLDVPLDKFFFPVSSMTITHLDAKCKGFRSAKVTEFYVNRVTNNLVIAVTLTNYNFSSTSFFSYQRKAREPIVLQGYSSFELDELTLTAIIPKVPNLRLEMAEIYARTPDVEARHYISPGNYECDDPTVKLLFGQFKKNLVTVIKEVFPLAAYQLMSTFLQVEICDFGVDTKKNYNGYLNTRQHVGF